MIGMKFIYKRGFHWRSWRQVKYSDKKKKMVSYKCHDHLPLNETCENCGLWTIDETPSCPYEIFSIRNKTDLCGLDYTRTINTKSSCPTTIKIIDLAPTCDNPMETVWRFTKVYNSSLKYENVLCNGKDSCEIFTYYLISRKNIIFKIINSTNNIIYSRIMEPNNTNYICINDCGYYDRNTNKFKRFDIPTKLDLLAYRKNKRDIATKRESMAEKKIKGNQLSLQKIGGKSKMSELKNKILKNNIYNKSGISNNKAWSLSNTFVSKMTTPSMCNRLKKTDETFEAYENYDNYLIL
ncbi:uncharacterized protein LOC142985585 [Anticarsia gemmatalis]|uniref:uncharacterized protein LOC142985585 n=1 Tax=Anticarsia gemmatalis TaxID=129554 RepID=UPI003F76E564